MKSYSITVPINIVVRGTDINEAENSAMDVFDRLMSAAIGFTRVKTAFYHHSDVIETSVYESKQRAIEVIKDIGMQDIYTDADEYTERVDAIEDAIRQL